VKEDAKVRDPERFLDEGSAARARPPGKAPWFAFLAGMGQTLKHMVRPHRTIHYPDEFRRIPDHHRGRVTLREERCIGCTQCSMACPNASCTMEDGPMVENREHPNKKGLYPQVDVGRCMYCGLCEEVCPTDAIYLDKEFRMSSDDRQVFDYNYRDQSTTDAMARLRRSR